MAFLVVWLSAAFLPCLFFEAYVCAGVVSQHLRAFYCITAATKDPQGVFVCAPVSGEYL